MTTTAVVKEFRCDQCNRVAARLRSDGTIEILHWHDGHYHMTAIQTEKKGT